MRIEKSKLFHRWIYDFDMWSISFATVKHKQVCKHSKQRDAQTKYDVEGMVKGKASEIERDNAQSKHTPTNGICTQRIKKKQRRKIATHKI